MINIVCIECGKVVALTNKVQFMLTSSKNCRNVYRPALRKFIQCKENSKLVDLCKASKVDENSFWKMLKKVKRRVKLLAFWLMESLSTQTRILPICELIILNPMDNQL